MKLQRRVIACLLAASLVACGTSSSGCTTMRTVKPNTVPGNPPSTTIKPGDTVSIRLKDGREKRFVVQALDSDAMTSASGVRYPLADIVEAKVRRASPPKTIALVAGIAVGTCFVLFAIAFAALLGSLSEAR